ncbi:hypothetical protein Tco_0437604 [Tanacetum coccineum]
MPPRRSSTTARAAAARAAAAAATTPTTPAAVEQLIEARVSTTLDVTPHKFPVSILTHSGHLLLNFIRYV